MWYRDDDVSHMGSILASLIGISTWPCMGK